MIWLFKVLNVHRQPCHFVVAGVLVAWTSYRVLRSWLQLGNAARLAWRSSRYVTDFYFAEFLQRKIDP